jgi:hypothetical protein
MGALSVVGVLVMGFVVIPGVVCVLAISDYLKLRGVCNV